MCGRWLTAASTASCSSAPSRLTRAPHALQASATRSMVAGAFSASGVSTTRRSRKSVALAACAPLCSAPAIGCPGTNCASFAPSVRRAAAITSHLVLPASVTAAPGARASARSAKIAGNCATGAATSTRSASRAAAPASGAMVSMRPRRRASSRFSRLRPAPVTWLTLPACFSAAAKEPPIKPTPITASFIASSRRRASVALARGERRKEALVLLGRADGDAQVLRQLVGAADRADDAAAAEEPLVDFGRLADTQGQEVAVRRNIVEAETLRPVLQLPQALQVLGVAARDEFHVVEGGARRGERQAVDIEGLTHAIHDVGDRRMRECVADAQAGEPVGLGERARQDQVGMALYPFHAVGAQVGRQVFVV